MLKKRISEIMINRIGVRNTKRTRVFDYKIDSINSVASAVAFLLNIRTNNNVFIKHIDLDDDLRNSEGSG